MAKATQQAFDDMQRVVEKHADDLLAVHIVLIHADGTSSSRIMVTDTCTDEDMMGKLANALPMGDAFYSAFPVY